MVTTHSEGLAWMYLFKPELSLLDMLAGIMKNDRLVRLFHFCSWCFHTYQRAITQSMTNLSRATDLKCLEPRILAYIRI
jgi:hypothetical protein